MTYFILCLFVCVKCLQRQRQNTITSVRLNLIMKFVIYFKFDRKTNAAVTPHLNSPITARTSQISAELWRENHINKTSLAHIIFPQPLQTSASLRKSHRCITSIFLCSELKYDIRQTRKPMIESQQMKECGVRTVSNDACELT